MAPRAALLIACCFTSVAAQRWSYGSCAGATQSNLFALGDSVPLCVHLNGNITALFTPVVDTMAALSITGSNYALPAGSGFVQENVGWVSSANATGANCSDPASSPRTLYMAFDVQTFGVTSDYPRVYKRITYDPCNSANNVVDTMPVYTVIISMSSGVINFITFDDGCIFCATNGADCLLTALNSTSSTVLADSTFTACRQASSSCYTGSVTSNSSSTNSSGSTNSSSRGSVTIPSSSCDLRLFVVWSGTDRNGQFLSSINRRFSRFRQFGTSTLQQSTLNVGNAAVSIGVSTLNTATGIPGAVVPSARETLAILGVADAAPPSVAELTPHMEWLDPVVWQRAAEVAGVQESG